MPSFDQEVVARRRHVRSGATPGRRGPIAVDAGDAARLVEALAALGALGANVAYLETEASIRGHHEGGQPLSADMAAQIAELRAILGIEASGG